ncbi:hypothetical protein EF888_14965 [Silicimonas algicola]|uniref:hypothetical protein n=1 Tax=Silicimonas algicola TaxID=1826607 RepID=UPI000D6BB297|nr:hypothetical protein [Silicimonas algicola]AZQ68321.1 hypothetical protein EF888_14965 [Silicimonas algicola]
MALEKGKRFRLNECGAQIDTGNLDDTIQDIVRRQSQVRAATVIGRHEGLTMDENRDHDAPRRLRLVRQKRRSQEGRAEAAPSQLKLL